MVDTAVILAGRKETFFDMPVSLIEIEKGISLLSRCLQLLEEAGIQKILLVAGFKSELFEAFRAELQIIVNPEYIYTSSMASLALAEPYIKDDFILIESDTLFEKTVLTSLINTDKNNCLSIVNESGNGDEAFVELTNNFVAKISKDKHQFNRIDGEMIGVSKISLNAYRHMILRWANNQNPYVNYEYLLLDCVPHYEIEYIKFNNLIWGEVDNVRDFRFLKETVYPQLCRKENPYNEQNIVAYMQQIFPDETLSILKIEQIGGMTNQNFKITLPQTVYVLRIPGYGTEGMVERSNEGINSRLSFDMGITPEILYLNASTGVKLVKYIEGAETMTSATIQRPDNLKKVIRQLRTLHRSAVRFNNDFNVFREIILYEQLLERCGGEMYEGYDRLREELFAFMQRLNKLGIELSPCHNDLVAENFVKDKHGDIYVIDWEYSGMNDPMWDLAAAFIESDFTEENRELALDLYFEGNIPSVMREKIEIYQILMDTLWAIWARIKEKQGDDFGSYGIMRYTRAIHNLNRLRR